jgi:hypothetical protein
MASPLAPGFKSLHLELAKVHNCRSDARAGAVTRLSLVSFSETSRADPSHDRKNRWPAMCPWNYDYEQRCSFSSWQSSIDSESRVKPKNPSQSTSTYELYSYPILPNQGISLRETHMEFTSSLPAMPLFPILAVTRLLSPPDKCQAQASTAPRTLTLAAPWHIQYPVSRRCVPPACLFSIPVHCPPAEASEKCSV